MKIERKWRFVGLKRRKSGYKLNSWAFKSSKMVVYGGWKIDDNCIVVKKKNV